VRSITGSEEDVARLLDPGSIAVIGASSRPGALSWWPLHLLQQNGFKGRVFPINPQRDSIDGVPCYRSLGELPLPPELAVIAMNADRTLEAVRECADAGVKAVVLPTQGFGELGEAGRSKERELASLAGPGKLRIVGTNTDGVGNLATGAIASIQPLFGQGIEPGPVAVATQSGATAGSLLVRLKREGIGCRLYASAGNETDLGLVDYLSVMVQDPEVKLVLSFVEALRRPREFLSVAEMAAELDKPIALIKVGGSDQGARRAAAHTGALAGDDELYDATFRSCGVLRVSELSELVAVAKLRLGRAPIRGRGVGILSVSGGQAGAIADKAAALRIPVPAVSAQTEHRLGELLTFGQGFNPCDLTGEIATKPSLAASVYEAFGQEQGLSTIVYARKQLTGTAGVDAAVGIATAARAPGAAPLAIYAMDGVIGGKEHEVFDHDGIPVFSSLNDLFVAIDRLADYQEFRSGRARAGAGSRSGRARAGAGGQWASVQRVLPAVDGIVSDAAAKSVLVDYGLKLPRERLATDAAAAVSAAEDFGYPVVVKAVSDRIAHKTEAGGVELGLGSAEEVRLAYERVLANAGRFLGDLELDGVLVQEQVQGGIELIAGVKVDPALGPFILVGMGGVLAELLKDVALRPAPVSPETAREMIAGLRAAALLDGYRGAPRADVDAAAEAVSALSRLAADYSDSLRELDVNPLLVLPRGQGVRVADVLMVVEA